MTGREGSQGRDSFGKIRVTAELSLLWRDDGQAAMPLAVRVTPSEFVSGDNICLEKEDVINLLLISVALEELGLAQIINVEGEKAQFVLKTHGTTLDDLLTVNDKIDRILKDVIKKEILLQFKLDHIMDLIEKDKSRKRSRCD